MTAVRSLKAAGLTRALDSGSPSTRSFVFVGLLGPCSACPPSASERGWRGVRDETDAMDGWWLFVRPSASTQLSLFRLGCICPPPQSTRFRCLSCLISEPMPPMSGRCRERIGRVVHTITCPPLPARVDFCPPLVSTSITSLADDTTCTNRKKGTCYCCLPASPSPLPSTVVYP